MAAIGDHYQTNAQLAAARIADHYGCDQVEIAVVLGSGMSDVLGDPTGGLPMGAHLRFGTPRVPGHAGTVRVDDIAGRRCLIYAGRVHLYEGHRPDQVVHNVAVAAALGAHTILLTNAAGGIRDDLSVGQIVAISDHLNLTGVNPLVGRPDGFVDLTDCYSPRIRHLARRIHPGIPEGVYAAFGGPSYETPAEVRAARTLGADMVGMSTVLEAITARWYGLDVAGVSLITNRAAGCGGAPTHSEVTAVSAEAGPQMGEFLTRLIGRL